MIKQRDRKSQGAERGLKAGPADARATIRIVREVSGRPSGGGRVRPSTAEDVLIGIRGTKTMRRRLQALALAHARTVPAEFEALFTEAWDRLPESERRAAEHNYRVLGQAG